MRPDQVFGISPEVRENSYVDRGNLDDEMSVMLARPIHIAVRGPSKSGKSWLRQKVLDNPITVQCRLKKPFTEIYVDALSQLDINIQIKESHQGVFKASISAMGKAGATILAKVGLTGSMGRETTSSTDQKIAGHDIHDLRYIADIIKASGRRLVIEDFHYMSTADRRNFAFDLKALWDYRVFVVIIGVWSETNLLLHLNPDLTGRVKEISIDWVRKDLLEILTKGGVALHIDFSPTVQNMLVDLSYTNAGLLQALTLHTLDEANISGKDKHNTVDKADYVEGASMTYAEELNPLYQQFAKRVAAGVRTRKNSTGIYAHAMAVIMEATDEELVKGLNARTIYERAVIRQERIQYNNLKAILEQLEGLQVDDDGRGLIIGYSTATEEITIVDRQLLLYRRFATVKWPWEALILEAEEQGGQVEA